MATELSGLSKAIDELWAGREELSPNDGKARSVVAASPRPARRRHGKGRRDRPGRLRRRARVAEGGHPAVVPPLGGVDARGRPVRVRGQDPTEEGLRGGGRAGRSRRLRPLGVVPRARRHPDAELRQHRRPRRRGHDGGHVGHGRLVRSDRRTGPSLRWRRHRRSARAAERRSCDDRGRRPRGEPLDCHPGRADRPWGGRGGGHHPQPVDPRHRRRDGRGAEPRRRAALERRRRCHAPAGAPGG